MHARNLGSARLCCSCLTAVAAIACAGYWALRAPANPSRAGTVVQKGGLIEVCHRPPGNPNNRRTITIDPAALPAHLAHGDTLGPCDGFSDEIQQILEGLGDRATQLGLDLDLDQALVVAGQGATIVAAPSSTLEDTPPLVILSGEFLGLAFMDVPGANFPAGFYRCRAILEDPQLGAHPVDVELVDEDGQVAGVLPGVALVGSLVLPREPREATVAGFLAPEVFETVDPKNFQPPLPSIGQVVVIEIWWLCDNGVWICMIIIIAP